MDATEVRERAAFWGAICKLLLLMPSPEQSLSSAALPEDWQLRAFGPLNAAHQHLNFQLPRTEKVCSFVLSAPLLWLPSWMFQNPPHSHQPPSYARVQVQDPMHGHENLSSVQQLLEERLLSVACHSMAYNLHKKRVHPGSCPGLVYFQEDGELRLQRILRSLKGIADMLPEQTADQAAQTVSPPRQEELAAAAGFQRAVLRMFGAHDKVRRLVCLLK